MASPGHDSTPPKRTWDAYWQEAAAHRGLFAKLAKVYRRRVIAPALRHYFERYLPDQPGAVYLHAGCGSGESDHRIAHTRATFVLLDRSSEALRLARRLTRFARVHLVCGDLFALPFRDETVSGIWNLGVMEHFDEADLVRIFEDFARVLRRDGRLMLLWPPVYGLSVIVLGSVLFVANRFRRTPMAFFPDEISRFSTLRWLNRLANRAGLAMTAAHFGPRDAFTYAVVVGERRGAGS